MLTERQRSIYNFIVRFRQQHGCSPSIPEIQREFAIRSPNGVAGHLTALERKGYIRRSRRGSRQVDVPEKEPSGIPLYGQIPAGLPDTLATEAPERILAIDNATLGFPISPGCFALRVRGESMRDAGILPGDIVIVDPHAVPRANQVVVALIDGENTLKRLVQQNGAWYLQAENPDFSALIPRAELVIQGVVRALIRRME